MLLSLRRHFESSLYPVFLGIVSNLGKRGRPCCQEILEETKAATCPQVLAPPHQPQLLWDHGSHRPGSGTWAWLLQTQISQPHPSAQHNFIYLSFYFLISLSAPPVLPNSSFIEQHFRIRVLDKGSEEEWLLAYFKYINWISFSPKEGIVFSSCYLICFNKWNKIGFCLCVFPKLPETQNLISILKGRQTPAADSLRVTSSFRFEATPAGRWQPCFSGCGYNRTNCIDSFWVCVAFLCFECLLLFFIYDHMYRNNSKITIFTIFY